ncbi:MAG TPA: LuxR C-terminal-related transcriptional regulator, partial [Candidatus Dormibacteraeota bacterium]|nr:LuxR C-terminal-related transcriptional regulator [Candidatus Dormibacteraeota bacterium]
SVPGLVIATYRDDELGRSHPLRAVLGEISRRESVVRVKLQPLSYDAVATLARSHRLDVDELHRKTAGNPFFVTEVLASGEDAIPDTVRDAVLARSSRLSSQARSLLDAVSVTPQHAELWLLEAVDAECFGGLGECLDAGMLTRRNGAVAFRHDLARLAIEDSIPPDRALQLHRQTLHALATSPRADVDPARLAYHAERAQESPSLLRFGHAAGRRASAVGAHREAVSQLARALTVAGSLPALDRAELLQEFANECLHVSQVDRAIEAQEEAVNVFRQSADAAREADALRRLSRFYMCGVRALEARQPVERAIKLLETLPLSKELALGYSGLAMVYMNNGDAGPAIRAARRAIELAEQIHDDEALLYTLNSLGTLETLMGLGEGREKLLRSLEMADQLGMDEHVGRAYLNLAESEVLTRSYDGLLELIGRGTEYCSQHGLELWRMWLLTSEARTHLDRGDLSRATEVADEVLHGERGQLPRISALPVLGLARARRGDPQVWPLLNEAKAMADRDGELQYSVPVAVARAEAAWLEGRAGDVREETEALFRTAADLDAWWFMGEMTCWRMRAGIKDEVHPKLPERYAAELRGDFAQAAKLWSGLGCEYDGAMALAASDDDDLLKQALVKLQRLGTRAAAAVVAGKLRARGATGISRGPRSTTQSNPAMLTDRELEILELVTQGMRNGDIAKRLFLAPKTVDHHVSAILRKLAVDNRAQAGREASRLGLFG